MEKIILLSEAKKAVKLVHTWGEDCRLIPYDNQLSVVAIGVAQRLRISKRKSINLNDFLAETSGTISMETGKSHYLTIHDKTKEVLYHV